MAKARRIRRDFTVIVPFLIIALIGLLTLAGLDHYSFKRQVVWHLLGLSSLLLLLRLVDKSTLKEWSPVIYAVMLVLLVAVLVVGKASKGAQRWLPLGPFRLQPSEFAKLSLALVLGLVMEKITDAGGVPLGFREVAILLLVAFPMFGLVLVQPDLGTALIFLLMAASVAAVAGLRRRVIVASLIAAVVVGYLGWTHVLKEYQKNRIRAFLNPAKYRTSIGYHVIQSRIAIGSGRIWGKGYMKATQANLGFMPEKSTDFIFASYAESFGFAGVVVLVLLYAFLFSRMGELASKSRGLFEFYSIVAIASVFFWHAFINIGMTMGMLPVVGVPLPLMSYGGSATLSAYLGLGCILVLSEAD